MATVILTAAMRPTTSQRLRNRAPLASCLARTRYFLRAPPHTERPKALCGIPPHNAFGWAYWHHIPPLTSSIFRPNQLLCRLNTFGQIRQQAVQLSIVPAQSIMLEFEAIRFSTCAQQVQGRFTHQDQIFGRLLPAQPVSILTERHVQQQLAHPIRERGVEMRRVHVLEDATECVVRDRSLF